MDFYKILMEKGKKEGIEKNIVWGVIFNSNNEVLIISRNKDDFMGGIDELPSGNMEIGETIPQSLDREIKEETNLDIESIESYITSFDYLSGSGKKSRQYNFLLNVKSTEDVKLTEHDNFKWMSLEDAITKANITEEVRFVLECVKFNLK